jgi:hypothetical protein
MGNVPVLMKVLKILNCKKLKPFILLNVYKLIVLSDICKKFNIEDPVYVLYKVLYEMLGDPKINYLRSIRQGVTLTDFYMLMDTIQCNAILYNNLEYVSYLCGSLTDPWLVMKIESTYDLTYMGVHENIYKVLTEFVQLTKN